MKYREIAKMAIKKYDIAVHSLTFLAEETNVFYLLGSGESAFVMKIFQEASSDINDNLTEHFLISTLLDKTEIKTPKVIRNKHGETVTKIAFPNPRGYKRVALYEYIEAEAVDGQENMEYFRTVGGLIAKMHIATENLKFPEHVNPKKWEDIFYYENETPVYHKKKYKRFITQEMISILDELIPYINEKLKLFYTNMTPRLIHGDLNPWNIKIKGEEIVFFDFEEAKLAFPLHDIAVFLYYYRHHETLNYQEVKKAFLEGYTQFRPMPKNLDDKNLDLVMISRRINFFNYVLTIRKDPSEYIAMSFPIIKEYYLSYK